jgi:hypothetical protein
MPLGVSPAARISSVSSNMVPLPSSVSTVIVVISFGFVPARLLDAERVSGLSFLPATVVNFLTQPLQYTIHSR